MTVVRVFKVHVSVLVVLPASTSPLLSASIASSPVDASTLGAVPVFASIDGDWSDKLEAVSAVVNERNYISEAQSVALLDNGLQCKTRLSVFTSHEI